MSVAYQSSGSVAQMGNTWSYTNPVGSNCIVIAIQSGVSSTDTISALTYGGVTIPLIGWQNSDNQSSGGVALYGLVSGSLPTGANNIVATGYTGNWLGAASYSGAGSFGTAVKAYGTTAGAGPTVTVTGTTTGGMCVAASSYGGAGGGGVFSASGGDTLRWYHSVDNGGGADNGVYLDRTSAGGGASTSLSWSNTTYDDWYGTVAVEILPPSSTPVSGSDTASAAESASVQATVTGSDSASASESGSALPQFTVTATPTGGSGITGGVLRVTALTGAKAAGSQAGATASNTTGTFDQSISVTATGSVIYGAAANWTNDTSFTADAATTFTDNYAGTTTVDQGGTFRSTAATSSTGSHTYGASAPTGDTGVLAMAEILADTTIAEDPSTASAVTKADSGGTLTSPSIAPPAGALLVVRLAFFDNTNPSSAAITDTSGLGLTWTRLAQATNSGGSNNYAAIFIAQIPGGGSTNIAGSDSAAAAEASSVQATLSKGDTVAGAEASSIQSSGSDSASAAEDAHVGVSSADTGHGAESASIQASLSGADTVHAAEASSIQATLSSADTGHGTEASSSQATLSSADSAGAAETGSASSGTNPSSADTVQAVESAFYYHLNADTESAAEGAHVGVSSADSAVAADAPLNAWPGSSDVSSGADAPMNAWPTSADVALAIEAWAPFSFVLADSTHAADQVHDIGIWTYIETGIKLLAPAPYRHDPAAAARYQAAVDRLSGSLSELGGWKQVKRPALPQD